MLRHYIQIGRTMLWYRRLGSLWWSRRLALKGIKSYEDVRMVNSEKLRIGDGMLVLPKTERAAALLECMPELRAISLAGGQYVTGDRFDSIEIDEVKLLIFDVQALCLVAEIFVNHIYAVSGVGEFVVLDVGMNVGTAALYFARTAARVIGFEPFRETYDRAMENLKANAQLAEKVEAVNVAWGGVTEVRTAEYSPLRSGDCGFFEMPERSEGTGEIRTERIDVHEASKWVLKAKEQYPDQAIALKLDCEGAEYEILLSLQESAVLKLIRVIILEWHRRAGADLPEKIRNLLVANGYVLFGHPIESVESGLMRCVRA